MEHNLYTQKYRPDHSPASLTAYSVGFASSVTLTLVAFGLVASHALAGWYLIGAITGLAVAQLLVQLVCFLHLGRETKPRWNLTAFFFMLIMLLIVVAGSLWIMYNLNRNMMMSPQETNIYMLEQGQKGF